MLSWAEEYSRRRIHLAPQGARVVMNQMISHKNALRGRVLKAYGFNLVRHFLRMEINLEEAPPAPEIPAGLIIEPITPLRSIETRSSVDLKSPQV